MSHLYLLIPDEGGAPKRVPLAAPMTIGRRAECEVHIAHETVSGQHARIVERQGALFVEDLGSQNKTVVEDGPTLGRGDVFELRPGTVLLFGRVRAEVESDAPRTRATDPEATRADDGATIADPERTAVAPAEAGGERTVRDPTAVSEATASEATVSERTERDPGARTASPAAVPAAKPPTKPATKPAAKPPTKPGHDSSEIPDDRLESPDTVEPDVGGAEFITVCYDGAAGGDAGQMADEGALEGMRPRLVIDHEIVRRIVPIRSTDFVVGRSDAVLSIRHPALSNPHARIRYEARKRFRVEDLGSKNFTSLNGEVLPEGIPREIPPEAHLRFGPIDALFVVSVDYDGIPVSSQWLQTAVTLLEADGKITTAQRTQAEQDAREKDQHVGEMLILSKAITVREWVTALHNAEIAIVARKLVDPQLRALRTGLIGLSVLLVALALWVLL